jgi:hypothetical protein
MNIATGINLENITTGEAKLTLDKVINQIATNDTFIIDHDKYIDDNKYDYSTLISREDLTIIAYALENNIQLRDYLMGLTSDGLSVESVTNILRVLSALVKCAELPAYPIETVLASYMYRLGDSDAPLMLTNGLSRGYSLANILQRVMINQLNPAEFARMANELHGKVIAELTRTQELLLNEANR